MNAKKYEYKKTSEWLVGGLSFLFFCRRVEMGSGKEKTLRLTVAILSMSTAARSGHEETPQHHLDHSSLPSNERRGRAD